MQPCHDRPPIAREKARRRRPLALWSWLWPALLAVTAMASVSAMGQESGDRGARTGEDRQAPQMVVPAPKSGREDGVVTPPRVDPDIVTHPPGPERFNMPVIRPPGAPGNPAPVQPK